MTEHSGRFLWYELMTTDPPAARAFYNQVVGWDAEDGQMPGMDYWMFRAGETPVAGVMELPEPARAMGAPPNWLGYVGVDDVDASVAAVTASGGQVFVDATDIPNVGRFAVTADPHGAALALFTSANPDQDQPPLQDQPGHIGWNELMAGDLEAEFDYYNKLFGWGKLDAMDMGDMGVYQIYGKGEVVLGGMMKTPPDVPPHWGYYFNVGNIDDAAERVKASGGQVIMGPMDVPGGQFVLAGIDPQGAHFALLGSR